MAFVQATYAEGDQAYDKEKGLPYAQAVGAPAPGEIQQATVVQAMVMQQPQPVIVQAVNITHPPGTSSERTFGALVKETRIPLGLSFFAILFLIIGLSVDVLVTFTCKAGNPAESFCAYLAQGGGDVTVKYGYKDLTISTPTGEVSYMDARDSQCEGELYKNSCPKYNFANREKDDCENVFGFPAVGGGAWVGMGSTSVILHFFGVMLMLCLFKVDHCCAIMCPACCIITAGVVNLIGIFFSAFFMYYPVNSRTNFGCITSPWEDTTDVALGPSWGLGLTACILAILTGNYMVAVGCWRRD